MSKQTAAAFYHAAAVFPRDAGFCFTRGKLFWIAERKYIYYNWTRDTNRRHMPDEIGTIC